MTKILRTYPVLPRRDDESRRPSAAKRGYDYNWGKARRMYLREHPLCVLCAEAGRTVPATVVDHITPHRGDPTLFYEESNWQALCIRCHNRKSAHEQ